jgi:hypothetical protein
LSLAQIIYSAGQLLAQHIDKYLHQASVSYTRNALTDIVNNGDHSGTFYHYYFNKTLSKNDDTWGAWHNDFSALTGKIYIFFFILFEIKIYPKFFFNRNLPCTIY